MAKKKKLDPRLAKIAKHEADGNVKMLQRMSDRDFFHAAQKKNAHMREYLKMTGKEAYEAVQRLKGRR